ncbi:hypothetical protein C487_09344 [Natrinema pallidum DSM 3751]|uniref:Haloacid dehalogenase n=1 Tax=Natrinema pallidum DSM 3751 TaxID=1227495 RepID=L9YX25_9EURY|nr:hypothetical protein C487_09344 [Natrinema pallidum DSM 3751]
MSRIEAVLFDFDGTRLRDERRSADSARSES